MNLPTKRCIAACSTGVYPVDNVGFAGEANARLAAVGSGVTYKVTIMNSFPLGKLDRNRSCICPQTRQGRVFQSFI